MEKKTILDRLDGRSRYAVVSFIPPTPNAREPIFYCVPIRTHPDGTAFRMDNTHRNAPQSPWSRAVRPMTKDVNLISRIHGRLEGTLKNCNPGNPSSRKAKARFSLCSHASSTSVLEAWRRVFTPHGHLRIDRGTLKMSFIGFFEIIGDITRYSAVPTTVTITPVIHPEAKIGGGR